MKKLITALLVIIWLIPAKAQENDGMKPLEVAKIKTVSDVKISDDGKYSAYMLNNPADPLKENKPANIELYIYLPGEGQSIPFITRSNISEVSFRPKHQSITFLATMDDEKNSSLYEIPLTGGEAVNLFTFNTSISDYDWSPDGEKIVFIAAEKDKDENEAKAEKKLPYQPKVYEEELAMHHAWVVSLNNKEDVKKVQVTGHFYDVKWSPGGNKIAVATAPTPLVDDRYMKQSIHIADAENLKETGSVDHQGKLGEMAFNPDGTKLVFIGGADIHDPIAGRLFVVSSNGGSPENLCPDYEGKFESFEWSNNQIISFISSEGVWSAYGTIQSDGSDWKKERLEDGPVLRSFYQSQGGTVVFAADTPEHPGELYLKQEDSKPQRVTFHNEWLENVALGEQEVVIYQAEDGLEIQGLLIKPLQYVEGRQYPLITVVHGGPESHYSNGWLTNYSTVGQVGAALGYAVFYPNYRGSTGRGEVFLKSSQRDLAGKEFDDVVDGVDYLVAQGIADEKKVGVTGGSYGGYATGWFATRYTDRFAAGVMFVGISNNISSWGTSDIPEELYLVHTRQQIWEDYEFFLERSPVYYAGQSKTPLLIMAGEDDTRVHPSQSIELYRHIKTRTETPVRLVLYPGEGHGNRNATARLDYSLRQLRWFEKYLKDKPIEMGVSVLPEDPSAAE